MIQSCIVPSAVHIDFKFNIFLWRSPNLCNNYFVLAFIQSMINQMPAWIANRNLGVPQITLFLFDPSFMIYGAYSYGHCPQQMDYGLWTAHNKINVMVCLYTHKWYKVFFSSFKLVLITSEGTRDFDNQSKCLRLTV